MVYDDGVRVKLKSLWGDDPPRSVVSPRSFLSNLFAACPLPHSAFAPVASARTIRVVSDVAAGMGERFRLYCQIVIDRNSEHKANYQFFFPTGESGKPDW